MAEEKFETNILRMISAELLFLSGLQAAREMFGKSYFSLGAGEKAAVDDRVIAMIGANYNLVTPEYLRSQTVKPAMGFQQSTDQKP